MSSSSVHAVRRILLAEDNPADVLLVREALRNHQVSCELDVLSDGDQAVRYIDALDASQSTICPELLLLDMHLPKRDGEQILLHLRASERCPRTPVIIMTSSESPTLKRTAERHAALHYFQKPSSLDGFMLLGGLIKEVLDSHPTSAGS